MKANLRALKSDRPAAGVSAAITHSSDPRAWLCTSRKMASYVLLGPAPGNRCPEDKAQRYMQQEQTSEQDAEP